MGAYYYFWSYGIEWSYGMVTWDRITVNFNQILTEQGRPKKIK